MASKGQSPKEETTSVRLRSGKSSNFSEEASKKTSENARKPSSMYIVFQGTLSVKTRDPNKLKMKLKL